MLRYCICYQAAVSATHATVYAVVLVLLVAAGAVACRSTAMSGTFRGFMWANGGGTVGWWFIVLHTVIDCWLVACLP